MKFSEIQLIKYSNNEGKKSNSVVEYQWISDNDIISPTDSIHINWQLKQEIKKIYSSKVKIQSMMILLPLIILKDQEDKLIFYYFNNSNFNHKLVYLNTLKLSLHDFVAYITNSRENIDHLLLIENNNLLKIYNLPKNYHHFNLDLQHSISLKYNVISTLYIPTDHLLLTITVDNLIIIYNLCHLFNTKCKLSLPNSPLILKHVHRNPIIKVFYPFKNNLNLLYSISNDNYLYKWKFNEEKKTYELFKKFNFNQSSLITAIDYHYELNLLSLGFKNNNFGVWKLENNHNHDEEENFTGIDNDLDDDDFYQINNLQLINLNSESSNPINNLKFNFKGDYILINFDKNIIWDWKSQIYIYNSSNNNANPLNCLTYSNNGNYLITGDEIGSIKIWNLKTFNIFINLKNHHENSINYIKFSKNKNILFTCSSDGFIKAFDLLRYRIFKVFTSLEPCQFLVCDINNTNDFLIAGDNFGFIHVWSIKTNNLLFSKQIHDSKIIKLQFLNDINNPNNNLKFLSNSFDGKIVLWDLENINKSKGFYNELELKIINFTLKNSLLIISNLKSELIFFDLMELKEIFMMKFDFLIKHLELFGDQLLLGSDLGLYLFDMNSKILLKQFIKDSIKFIQVSPSLESFSILTDQGLIYYSPKENYIPFNLSNNITPKEILKKFNSKEYLMALLMAINLDDKLLLKKVFWNIPKKEIPFIIQNLPQVLRIFESLLEVLIEFNQLIELKLIWLKYLIDFHGDYLKNFGINLIKLNKSLESDFGKLENMVLSNIYNCKWISS